MQQKHGKRQLSEVRAHNANLGVRLIAKTEAEGQMAIWLQKNRLASKKAFGHGNGFGHEN